jgi:hypothetical protein
VVAGFNGMWCEKSAWEVCVVWPPVGSKLSCFETGPCPSGWIPLVDLKLWWAVLFGSGNVKPGFDQRQVGVQESDDVGAVGSYSNSRSSAFSPWLGKEV